MNIPPVNAHTLPKMTKHAAARVPIYGDSNTTLMTVYLLLVFWHGDMYEVYWHYYREHYCLPPDLPINSLLIAHQ